MIALDSSILVGIIKGEPDARALIGLLDSEESIIGAPTLVETKLWCSVNLSTRSSKWLDEFIDATPGKVTAFTREMADLASFAFQKFGRASGHPARLNFGDCLSYAVSGARRIPLLFKGRDFGLTDVLVHPASIRS